MKLNLNIMPYKWVHAVSYYYFLDSILHYVNYVDNPGWTIDNTNMA